MTTPDTDTVPGHGSMIQQLAHPDLSGISSEEIAAAEAHDYPGVNENVEQGAVPLSKRLRNPRAIVSIVVPLMVLLLLAAALPGFHLDQLPGYIRDANPWWLLAALGIYYVGFPIRGYRWAVLIRGVGYPLKVKDGTEMVLISWLVNCVVPAKMGDVYRGYLLRINTGVQLSKTFGTIFIERIFDLIAIVVLGLAAGFWSFRSGMSEEVRIIFGVGLVVVVALVMGLFVVRNFGRRILTRLPVPHRIVVLYDQFEEGLFSVDRKSLAPIAIATVLIWTTEALRLYFVILAMGFADTNIGISGAFFVALIASLLTAVPFTPAGVGLVEGGMVFVLHSVYSVAQTEALAISLVDRSISVLSVIVVGSIAYVFSSKTRGNPEFTGGTPAVRTTEVAALSTPGSQGS
ncbi:MAG: flippase-like domain-containing protein [Chloroflexi bacterium]|nr:flippase-like domain-containing protein [Chloroflexota bacterium]